MSRTASTFILLVGLCRIALGQSTISQSNLHLEPYVLPAKVCVLFENDSFIVMTSTLELKNYYEAGDSVVPKSHEYRLFLDCYSENDTMDFYSCAKPKFLDDLVVYRASVMMTQGKCVVLNKLTHNPVTEIQTQPYDRFDVGGTSYYVGDSLLFETITRIY